jgi:putative transposase
MKASKFSEAQKAFILKQGADGMPVAEICRKAGISQATYFNWKKKYDGLLPTEMRRLKQLEDENAKLKRIVADLSLDMSTASVEWVVSIRRACRVFEVDTSTYHCKSRRPEQASLEARIREICQTRVPLRLPARPCASAARGLACLPGTP